MGDDDALDHMFDGLVSSPDPGAIIRRAADVWRAGMSGAPIPKESAEPRDGYQIERDSELEQMRQAIAKMGLKP